MARARKNKPTRPDDARTRRSIEAMSDAFLELLEDKSVDEIQIKDITERAGVSYPTFFRRFKSKGELLENIATAEIRAFVSIGIGPDTPIPFSDGHAERLEYVNKHRRRWTALLTGGAAEAMRQEFMNVSYEYSKRGSRYNTWLPLDLAIPYFTSATFEVLAWWLRQPEDYPIGNVEKLFEVLVMEIASRRRRLKLD